MHGRKIIESGSADVKVYPVAWLKGSAFLLAGDCLFISDCGSPELNASHARIALAKARSSNLL